MENLNQIHYKNNYKNNYKNYKNYKNSVIRTILQKHEPQEPEIWQTLKNMLLRTIQGWHFLKIKNIRQHTSYVLKNSKNVLLVFTAGNTS